MCLVVLAHIVIIGCEVDIPIVPPWPMIIFHRRTRRRSCVFHHSVGVVSPIVDLGVRVAVTIIVVELAPPPLRPSLPWSHSWNYCRSLPLPSHYHTGSRQSTARPAGAIVTLLLLLLLLLSNRAFTLIPQCILLSRFLITAFGTYGIWYLFQPCKSEPRPSKADFHFGLV